MRTFGTETGAQNLTWRQDYIHRDGQPLATVKWEGGEATYHFHPNHLGTPVLTTDSQGAYANLLFLYPYGEEKEHNPTNTERLRFTGHERDLNDPSQTTDDLDYMHARFCSPVTGRFLSVDPKLPRRAQGAPQRWHRYAYGGNNPLRLVDPDGRQEKPANPSILDTLKSALERVKSNQNALPNVVYMDGKFEQVGPSSGDMVLIAGTVVAITTFDDIFRASTPTENSDEIRRQQGGTEEANRQFDAAVDPETVEDKDGGIRIGTDRKTGRTIILREESTDSASEATLEEQRVTEHGMTRSRKVRFDPVDEEPEPEIE